MPISDFDIQRLAHRTAMAILSGARSEPKKTGRLGVLGSRGKPRVKSSAQVLKKVIRRSFEQRRPRIKISRS
jgi:hypothetical protein